MKYIALSGEIIEAEPPSKGERHKLKVLGKMHGSYGVNPDGKICGDCLWFRGSKHGRRKYFKCGQYGVSSSEASDWRKSWEACGKFEEIA